MAKRLFVGGLPYRLTSDELNKLFSEYGKINSADVIIDKYSGQSKGFGFVDMESEDEADKAIKKLYNFEIDGRRIIVSEARPREERSRFDNRNSNRSYRNSRG